MTRFNIILVAALLFAAAWIPATAQTGDPIIGDWKIMEGKYDTSRYDGTVRISSSIRAYLLHWNASGREYSGIGTMVDGKLFAAWGPLTNYGFVLYNILDDSTLQGQWMLSSDPDAQGSEDAIGGSLKAKNTVFQARGLNPDGSHYTGTIEMEREGDLYNLVWRVADNAYYGVALRVGSMLVVGWAGPSDNFGAVAYSVSGSVMRGRWVVHNGTSIGTENLARIPDRAAPGH